MDIKEEEYEYISLIKSHPDVFTYDKHNDIYYSNLLNLAIGNKRQLQNEIEKYCKSNNDKDKSNKLTNSYSSDELLCADFSNKGRCAVLPFAIYCTGRNIEKMLEEARRIKNNDKFVSDTVEAQLDGHLSTEEEIDLDVFDEKEK